MSAEFAKYEALGNDYIVLDPSRTDIPVTGSSVKLLCDRHRGVGGDGVLYGPFFEENAIRVQIFNSDGSECEKSGNGLRMFAHYLIDHGYVNDDHLVLRTIAGDTSVSVVDLAAGLFAASMGTWTFKSGQIPATGPERILLDESLEIGGEIHRIGCVNIGNPHCVVMVENPSREQTLRLGPLISRHAMFPNGTNVQFVRVRDRRNVDAEIWERGSGYTLASGSSSCAVACVLRALDFVDPEVTVHMPGGDLMIGLSEKKEILLTGESRAVAEGRFMNGIAERLKRSCDPAIEERQSYEFRPV